MKIRDLKTFTCLLSISCSICFSHEQIKAADFSKAQQTIVPPSYIQRGAGFLNPNNNGNLPALNALPSPSNPSASSSADSASTPAVDPMQLKKIQKRVALLLTAGQNGEAETLARSGLKSYPNNSILKTQFATATAAEAQRFLLDKDYDSAGKKARESLVAEPSNKKAKAVIGKVFQAQGLDPNADSAHIFVADGLAANGRLLEASVEYKSALNIKPSAAAHVGLGNLAIGKGQVVEANRHFERALVIDPNSEIAYRQRGAVRYMTHDIVGAHNDFSKAVSLNPNDQLASDALINLWKQEIANNPSAVNGHLGLARAYLQTNNLEAARIEYKTIVSMDPNNPALPAARASFKIALAKQEASKCVQAAKTLDGQGALSEANQKLTEASGYSPDDSQIHLYHGQVLERMGLTDQAHNEYMSVLKVDPSNVQAAQRLKVLQPTKGLNATEYSLGTNLPLRSAPPVAPSVNASLQNSQAPNTFNSNAFSPNNATPNTFNPNAFSPNNVAPNTLNPNGNLAPASPNNNIENVPLKAPISPAQTNQSNNYSGYYPMAQNLYYPDSIHVNTLANFASCVRALILIEQQALKNSGNTFNKDTNGYANSNTLSSVPPESF